MHAAAQRTARSPAGGQRLLTCADVLALPESLPTGDVRYELDDGRLIVMAPPGDTHAAIQANVGYELKLQGERLGHGKARTEVGVVLRRNPDRLVGADAAFVSAASLPLRIAPEGYLETIPDLAVEIRSRNDSLAELRTKIDDYLAAGVKIVWLIDPLARTVTVFRADQSIETIDESGVLDAEGVIPGFRLAVTDLLRE